MALQQRLESLESELKQIMQQICTAKDTKDPEYKRICKLYKSKKEKLEQLQRQQI